MKIWLTLISIALGELFFVVEVSRHGARAPMRFMEWDNLNKWPNGPGELVPEGYNQHYLIGKTLKIYLTEQKLVSQLSDKNVKFFASSLNRTKQSAMAQVLGLFNMSSVESPSVLKLPQDFFKHERLDLKSYSRPVDVYSSEVLIDPLLRPLKTCIEYTEFVERRTESRSMRKIYAKYKDVTSAVAEVLNLSMEKAAELAIDAYDSVVANKFMGYRYPEKLDDAWIERAGKLYMEVRDFQLYEPDALARFSGSALLSKISSTFSAKTFGRIEDKIHVYSAHDTTILNVFAALNKRLTSNPPFGSVLLFELHKLDGDYHVKILYNGEPAKLIGDKELCTYKEFLEYVYSRIYYNHELACLDIPSASFGSQKISTDSNSVSLVIFDFVLTIVAIVAIIILIRVIHKR